MSKQEVNIDDIIEEVMEEEEVDPRDIPRERPFNLKRFLKDLKDSGREKSLRYYHGKLPGEFRCQRCGRYWTSGHTFCILDLKRQTVKTKLYQKCLEDGDEAYPYYRNEDQVRRMVKWAVNLYLVKTKQRAPKERTGGDYFRRTAPHREDLCEICIKLGRPCTEL